MLDKTPTTRWGVFVQWGTLATSVAVVFFMGYSQLTSFERRVASSFERSTRNDTRLTDIEHSLALVNVSVASVSSDIRGIRTRLKRIEAQLDRISGDPHARADPFTGAQGRSLDARLKALEAINHNTGTTK